MTQKGLIIPLDSQIIIAIHRKQHKLHLSNNKEFKREVSQSLTFKYVIHKKRHYYLSNEQYITEVLTNWSARFLVDKYEHQTARDINFSSFWLLRLDFNKQGSKIT